MSNIIISLIIGFIPIIILPFFYLLAELNRFRASLYFDAISFILVFITTFIVLVFSEASLRYSVSSEILFYTYLIFPWFIFISSYLIFFKIIKNV